MTAEIVLIEDVFNPQHARVHSHDGPMIEWISREFPPHKLLGRQVAVARRNGTEIVPLADWDFTPEAGERVFFIITPADPVTVGLVLTKIAISIAVSMALAALQQLLFPSPSQPSHAAAPKPSPVYSVSVPQNAARLGEPLPVVYGRLATVPDLAAQPYTYFDSNDQYAVALLCVTMGEADVLAIYAGETDLETLPEGVADWRFYGPADHGQVHGVIQTDFGIVENMVTSPDVTGIEVANRDISDSDKRAVDFLAPDTIRIYASGDAAEPYADASGTITVSGTASNNGAHTIASVTQTSLYVDLDVSSGITPEPVNFVTRRTFTATDSAAKSGEKQLYTFSENPPAGAMAISAGDIVRISPTTGNVQVATVQSYKYVTELNDRTGVTHGLHYLTLKDVQNGYNTSDGGSTDVDELTNPATLSLGTVNEWAGWFLADRPGGTKTTRLYLDFEWPAGLYKANATTGVLESDSVTLRIQYQEVDANGSATGAKTTENLTVATTDILAGDLADDPKNTPLRLTHEIGVTNGWYRVRVRRTTAASTEATDQSRTIWSGLKAKRVVQGGAVYDNSTMLAVRLKATRGLSREAIGRIRVKLHRRLPPITAALSTDLGRTRNPARAAYDILTNVDYGLGMTPSDVVNTTAFRAARDLWQDAGLDFDHVFTGESSIWDALKLALQPALAEPIVYSGLVEFAHGTAQATATQMFSPANIVAGSMRIRFGFARGGDPDGFRVVYREADGQTEQEALWPASAIRPMELQIAGLTDGGVALDLAKVRWRQRRSGQVLAEFETEMEGRLVKRGERIKLAWPVFGWGDVALLHSASGLVLTLDRAVPVGPSTRYVVLRNDQGQPTSPIAATLAGDYQLTLGSSPGITLYGYADDREQTHVIIGDTSGTVTDMIVEEVGITDAGRVRISARAYVSTAWDGTAYAAAGV